MAQYHFKGKPIVKLEYTQMKWDGFGKQIIAEVNAQFKGTPAEISQKYKGANGQVTHSNLFRLFGINSVARKYGARIILPETSEVLLAQGKLPEAGGAYYDLGAILDFSGENHELAVDFYNRLPRELKDLDRFPAIALELAPVKSAVGSYGLSFESTAFMQLRTAKIIAKEVGNFSRDDAELFRTGLPSKLGVGERAFHTIVQKRPSLDNLGVVRLYLGRGGDLDCNGSLLAGASQDGRVALESAEGASQNFAEYALSIRITQKALEEKLSQEKATLEERAKKIEQANALLKA